MAERPSRLQLARLHAGELDEAEAAAGEGLGWREDDRAVEPLAEAARLDPDPRVREAATGALGDIGSARARDAPIPGSSSSSAALAVFTLTTP